jgi:hypothetical protein
VLETAPTDGICEFPLVYLYGECVNGCPSGMVSIEGKCYFGCEYEATEVGSNLNGECNSSCFLVNDYECNINSCEDITSSTHCAIMDIYFEHPCFWNESASPYCHLKTCESFGWGSVSLKEECELFSGMEDVPTCVFILDKDGLTGTCENKTNITKCTNFLEPSQCFSHNNVLINDECVWINEERCIPENTSQACSWYISENNCTETIDKTECLWWLVNNEKKGCIIKCVGGKYYDTTSEICENCKAGEYSTVGVVTCNKCPSGTYSETEGATSDSTCKICSAGTYSEEGSSSCTKCLTGTYSEEGSSLCMECGKGTEPNKEHTECVNCSAGEYNGERGGTCERCNGGEYSTEGAEKCNKCPSGTYSGTTGTSIESCIKCSAGTYSETEGATNDSTCKQCLPGSYGEKSGSSSCLLCPEGTYNEKEGSKSINDCSNCPLGYISVSGSSGCVRSCSSMNDMIDKCEAVDGCMVIGGYCDDNFCPSFLLESYEEECGFPCVKSVEENICVFDKCASYDEILCVEHKISRCGPDLLGRCHFQTCSEIDIELAYFYKFLDFSIFFNICFILSICQNVIGCHVADGVDCVEDCNTIMDGSRCPDGFIFASLYVLIFYMSN